MIPIAAPLIGEEERAAVDRILAGGQLSSGPETEAFEQEFGALVGGRHCVAVNSGTSALHVALLSLGIGAGDEVIVPSFTFAATANAVALTGATPVFVDIEPDIFCMDPAAAAKAVTPRTVAIIPVHLFGHPASMPALAEVADRHDLVIIEDAAQAHGAVAWGKPIGTWGAAAAFSFYPTKNMTTGEGGMVVVQDDVAARTARLLRSQGMDRPYENEIVGLNLRMTDMAAAIGRVQLRRLSGFTKARRENARLLTEAISGTDLTPPVERDDCRHVYHQYTVRSGDRDALVQRLEGAGIQARVYYPVPVHRLPAFSTRDDLPETERATAEVLSVPIGPHVGRGDLEQIIRELRHD